MNFNSCFNIRDPAGIRTQDPIIKSDVLYQLSYRVNKKSFPECGCKYTDVLFINQSDLRRNLSFFAVIFLTPLFIGAYC